MKKSESMSIEEMKKEITRIHDCNDKAEMPDIIKDLYLDLDVHGSSKEENVDEGLNRMGHIRIEFWYSRFTNFELRGNVESVVDIAIAKSFSQINKSEKKRLVGEIMDLDGKFDLTELVVEDVEKIFETMVLGGEEISKEKAFVNKVNEKLSPVGVIELTMKDQYPLETGLTYDNYTFEMKLVDNEYFTNTLCATEKCHKMIGEIGKEVFGTRAHFNNTGTVIWFLCKL